MAFQHVVYLPSQASGRGESVLKLWLVVGKDMLPVKYLCSNKDSFCVKRISWRSCS